MTRSAVDAPSEVGGHCRGGTTTGGGRCVRVIRPNREDRRSPVRRRGLLARCPQPETGPVRAEGRGQDPLNDQRGRGCGGVRVGREAPEARGPIAGPRPSAAERGLDDL